MLTAIKLAKPSSVAFFARDADALNKTVQFTVTLNQTARLVAHRQRRRGNRAHRQVGREHAGRHRVVRLGRQGQHRHLGARRLLPQRRHGDDEPRLVHPATIDHYAAPSGSLLQ